MNLFFTSPISRPSFDGGATVSGMTIVSYSINPDTLMGTCVVRAIEDGIAGSTHIITVGPFTGATTLAQQLAAIKNAVATALGVTFV